MKDCCKHGKKDKACYRKKDKKTFKLPRKFSKNKCKKPKGFTMRSSCAPYKGCFKKQKGGDKKTKKFLFNPNNPKKSFDVYIDKDPSDTIPIKYKTIKDVKETIKKLERLYKNEKYPHKRIWQVGMILKVRLEQLKNKKKTHYKIAERYLKFLGKRTKIKGKKNRKKSKFKI